MEKKHFQQRRNRYTGRTVLAVGAHPDDIELGMGGTAAWLSRAGARLIMAVVCVPNQYETRLAEARWSAEILGAELRLLFNHGCRRVEEIKTHELVKRIDDLVEELKPSVLFTHGPTELHQDHSLVYNACVPGMRLRPFDFFCYSPTSCRPMLGPSHSSIFVDISQTLRTKMNAINAHASQFSSRGLQTNFIIDAAKAQGRIAGVPYAEGLDVMRMLLV